MHASFARHCSRCWPCAATSAHAQDFRGAIGGRITDAQGGRLPGATVTVVNIATNAESTSTTDANGDFTIPYLTPGSYRVTVELQGFKKNVREVSRSESATA